MDPDGSESAAVLGGGNWEVEGRSASRSVSEWFNEEGSWYTIAKIPLLISHHSFSSGGRAIKNTKRSVTISIYFWQSSRTTVIINGKSF